MKQSDKRSAGLHVGSASIIMIFAVLCLTVFSTLSYMTAAQEQNLAKKAALAMEQYYAAEWHCEEQYEQIYDYLASGGAVENLSQVMDVQVSQKNGVLCIEYAEAIDNRQQLKVCLRVEGGSLHTEEWRVVTAEAHMYNSAITVWDGE